MELKFQRKKRDCDAGPSSSGYKSSKDVEVLTVEVQPTAEVEKENHKEQICLFFVFICCCSGEGNGTPLQYSCLENPMDGGAW